MSIWKHQHNKDRSQSVGGGKQKGKRRFHRAAAGAGVAAAQVRRTPSVEALSEEECIATGTQLLTKADTTGRTFTYQAPQSGSLKSSLATGAGGALAASPAGSAAVYASIPALGGLGVGLLRCITPDFDRPPSNTTFAGALSQAAAAVATFTTKTCS